MTKKEAECLWAKIKEMSKMLSEGKVATGRARVLADKLGESTAKLPKPPKPSGVLN